MQSNKSIKYSTRNVNAEVGDLIIPDTSIHLDLSGTELKVLAVPEESVLQAMASLCEKGYIHVQHENKPGGQNEGG